ncbi:Zinc finger MYM-type protein 6 [Holothuria leucospilota]|uniref:Zinc finger MYM-type protein 6 n=1 Tax=Holothuria leucospilota TaxID=206669 RepID=A0A9Q1H8E4_HOLLE|nr:Zinc finger MYM-type protein 6 [Holothuria leucospilota]
MVINAEVLCTNFIVEHNISIAVTEHTGPLFRKMFPDSAIAKEYSCSRTKTSQVITCLAKNDADLLTSKLKTQPFSIATDGSTDMDSVKLYPVLIKTFDNASGEVACQLLAIRECTERSTGENIFKILDSEFIARNIPWDNCLSFATDNASVMVGKHKGVATHIKQKNPGVFVVGCACHLMHLAAKKGCKCLRYQMDDLLVEIWYFIDKSQLHHKRIIELQVEHGQEVKKILKHVSTR